MIEAHDCGSLLKCAMANFLNCLQQYLACRYKSKLRASMHVTTLSHLTKIKQYHMQRLNDDG